VTQTFDPADLAALVTAGDNDTDDSQPVDLAALAAQANQHLAAAQADDAPRPRRPGGQLAARPLEVIFLLDVSASMLDTYGNRYAGERYGAAWDGSYAPQVRRIDALNTAMREALPAMQRIAGENPEAQVLLSIAAFSDRVTWLAERQPLDNVAWTDLVTQGSTALGAALRETGDRLSLERVGHRALPPLVVVVSDGQPTDRYTDGLAAFQAQPWAVKAVRVAIAVPGADEAKLAAFTGDPALVLKANDAAALVEYIKWASTAALKAASSPASQARLGEGMVGGGNVPIPAPPASQGDPASAMDVMDVW